MAKILLVVDAPGPAEFIEPVIPLLRKKNRILAVTVKESPYNILKKYRPIRCDKEEKAVGIYKKFKPDVLLVATSSLTLGPYVNGKFTKLAKTDKKKIICFQDYWANHRSSANFSLIKYWDVLLVPDVLAKKFVLQDKFKGKIIVTGSPAWDRLKEINVQKERNRLRKKFNLSKKDFVILHCGTGTPQSVDADEITYKFLIQTIRNLKKKYRNIIFISRPHPRDENQNRYKEWAPDLKLLDTSSIKLSEEFLPIADVAIAMYSTNLIHACYLKIPAISIMLANAGIKRIAAISLTDFPPNLSGATIAVYKESVKKLKAVIEKIMKDSKYRLQIKKNQEKLFLFSKESAAKKVAEAVEKNL